EMDKARLLTIEELYRRQADYMNDYWDKCLVEIEGDDDSSVAVRYSMFQLLQAVGKDPYCNVPAKGLSGERYEGHYFWDTEMYIQPFFTVTEPAYTRTLIEFRYRTLPCAIENARLYSRIIEAEDSLRSGERLTVLGMLAAEIAHEIRNPLTVIKLLVESMELEDSLDPRMRDDLQVVGEKINHLGEIVGRVLNFGKNQSFIFSKWDLLQIIRDSLQLVRYKMMKNRIRVVFDTDLRSAPIHCNRGQIQQVLLNLILNADQAMPDGGSLVLRVLVESVNGVRCVGVTLSDTGVGIPEEIRGSIFDSFLTDKPEGTGLGLAIVKRILKDHRGDIELAETSGEGTVFHFWIPMQD
ncbi:MAG TPA: ATP-binding protein, partial [Opitutales bacterium]|nr:ATP-binding protein [Opitutales bacterium]